MTTMSGAQAENGLRGETAGIDYKIAMMKKYILAYLLN